MEDFIQIEGADTHNLKHVSVNIPRNKLVVVTGVSGSGKSSLAFDTLYAEGQRRYVESLSAYARQFMGRMQKPKVEKIEGIPPAIAIQQKTSARNPRSTVGTVTEIYDYLKLLYARIGKTYSPVSGVEVKKNTIRDVVSYMESLPLNTRLYLLSPIIVPEGRTLKDQLALWQSQGFSRVLIDGDVARLDDTTYQKVQGHEAFLLVDRTCGGKTMQCELKRVGSYARADLEKLFGVKVFLDLWVKVKENWRESRAAVGNFGYREEK